MLDHGVDDRTLPSLGEPQSGAIGDFEDQGPLLEAPKGQVTATGWSPPEAMSFDEWAKEGRRLRAVHNGVLWALGDWLNFGEARFGETYAQAIEATGYTPQFLANVKWVSAKFTPGQRRNALSFSHHSEVAGLEPETAAAFLTVAEHDGMSTADLRKQVKEAKAQKRRDKPKPDPIHALIDSMDELCRDIRRLLLNESSDKIAEAIQSRDDAEQRVRTIRETADDLNNLLGFLR